MEIIWHILLTACLNSECRTQDVQWFKNKNTCEATKKLYEEIPIDGNWTSVNYICKPKDSVSL